MREWLWIECQHVQVHDRMVMNSVPTSILENGYEYSANKYMRKCLWIECQQMWENGYEYSANKDKELWLLKQC